MEVINQDHGAESVPTWVPLHISSNQTNEIKELIIAEEKTRTFVVDHDKDHDYGRSFTGLDQTKVLCLRQIKEFYGMTGIRPRVLDVGAGHALMSQKMTIAGAMVTAIEPHVPSDKIEENILKAKPFLKADEELGFNHVNHDALDYGNCPPYMADNLGDGYDLTWSGNLIHLFTPSEATAYVNNLFKITKAGGYAFATVHAPCQNYDINSYFMENKTQGQEFPGFFMTNNETHWDHSSLLPNGYRLKGIHAKSVKCDPVPLVSPTKTTQGLYGNENTKSWCSERTIGFSDEGTLYVHYTSKSYSHSTKHFFDKDTFSKLFTDAGFIVEDVLYMDFASLERVENLPIPGEGENQSIWVGIKARKPLPEIR